jgi:hypothetical protein
MSRKLMSELKFIPKFASCKAITGLRQKCQMIAGLSN